MASGGISGAAVAVASLGGVLIYAGFRGVSPLQALRDVASGAPPSVESHPTDGVHAATPSSLGQSGLGTNDSSLRGKVVAAAQKYTGDKYNQLKRTRPGFSDCSSFVDKALKDAGIDPPGSAWAASANYRSSPDWPTIPASQAQAGDIAISSGHMILITGAGGAAIGQQRTGVNVRTGTVSSLMGRQKYVYKTFKGYTKAAPGAGVGAGGGGGGVGSW